MPLVLSGRKIEPKIKAVSMDKEVQVDSRKVETEEFKDALKKIVKCNVIIQEQEKLLKIEQIQNAILRDKYEKQVKSSKELLDMAQEMFDAKKQETIDKNEQIQKLTNMYNDLIEEIAIRDQSIDKLNKLVNAPKKESKPKWK